MQDRVFTITRPTGHQVVVHIRTPSELADALNAHGWPHHHVPQDASLIWRRAVTRPVTRPGWQVARG